MFKLLRFAVVEWNKEEMETEANMFVSGSMMDFSVEQFELVAVGCM